MPIPAGMSTEGIISELTRSWRATGKIGNTKPKSKDHARRIAIAIALRKKREEGK